MIHWIHAGPPALAAFLASLVECVEALTIVLAVGSARGWRSAIVGASCGVLVLAVLVAVGGSALTRIPLTWLQLAIGVLLLLFGMRWLRTAVLRAASLVPLHDEGAIFTREQISLEQHAHRTIAAGQLDPLALVTTIKAVLLEGLEIVFIVIGVGSVGQSLVPPAFGAIAAAVVVTLLGIAIRSPLSRIPENTLKFAVGVLLSAFGTFWIGEGLRFSWPGADLGLPAIALGFLGAASVAVILARRIHLPGTERITA
jgi:Ca2+/H+ antiporter, TMEM165/GDT1 family